MHEVAGIPVPGIHGVGVELNGTFELVLGARDIKKPEEVYKGQRAVGAGKRVVERNGLLGGGEGPGVGLVVGHGGIFAKQVVAVGEPGIRLRVTGVMNDGLGVIIDGESQALRSSLVEVILTLEVKLLGLRIDSSFARWNEWLTGPVVQAIAQGGSDSSEKDQRRGVKFCPSRLAVWGERREEQQRSALRASRLRRVSPFRGVGLPAEVQEDHPEL